MESKEKKDPQEDPETEDPKDPEQSSETTEEEDLSPEDLKAELEETRKALRDTRREAKERRLALEALQKEKTEREEKELSEAEKLKKRAEEAEAKRLELEKENRDLKLRSSFDRKAQALKLSFANDTAAEDAYNALDPELVGDDLAGLEEAIKKVIKDRPYLLGKAVEERETPPRDGSLRGKSNQSTLTREAVEKKRGSISPL
jgi:hypothetical protein